MYFCALESGWKLASPSPRIALVLHFFQERSTFPFGNGYIKTKKKERLKQHRVAVKCNMWHVEWLRHGFCVLLVWLHHVFFFYSLFTRVYTGMGMYHYVCLQWLWPCMALWIPKLEWSSTWSTSELLWRWACPLGILTRQLLVFSTAVNMSFLLLAYWGGCRRVIIIIFSCGVTLTKACLLVWMVQSLQFVILCIPPCCLLSVAFLSLLFSSSFG